MRGWILYRKKPPFNEQDHGVLRLSQAAQARGVALSVYHPDQFELIVTEQATKSLLVDGQPISLPDFVLPRMGSNTSYFSLAVIRQLEHLGVYCCNTASAIEKVKDKLWLHQLLAYHHLPTPKTMLAKFPIDVEVVKREMCFPIVVKNVSGAQGNGISLCEAADQFTDWMELLYSNNNRANIILQEFVESSRGRDIRVFVIGDKVIGCMKRISETGFKANFSRGGKVEPISLTDEMQELALSTVRLVNLEIAGIDLLFGSNGLQICEANSAPGFRGLEQVIGETVAEEILDYIVHQVTLRRNKKKEE